MCAKPQEQSAALRRSQDLQEQRALANAQILTSMSIMAYSFKTRVGILSDLVEDEEENNGMMMGGLD